MRIQHNIAALNSYRQMGGNNNALSKNLEKLSSGYRINRAGDDAAGLAISEKMRAQIKGLETAQKNANDGISLVQTAEGALTEVHSMLNRMTELATQSANGTYENSVDRPNLQKEVEALKAEIDRISESTNFNGINLLDGSLAGSSGVAGSDVGLKVEGNRKFVGDGGRVQQITEVTLGATTTVTVGSKVNASIQMTDGTTYDFEFTVDSNKQLKYGDEVASTTALTGNALGGNTLAEAVKFALEKDDNFTEKYTITTAGGKLTFTSTDAQFGDPSIKVATTTVKGYDPVHTSGSINTPGKGEFKTLDVAQMTVYDSTNKDKKASESVVTVNGQKFAFVKDETSAKELGSDVHVVITGNTTAPNNAAAKEMIDLMNQKLGTNIQDPTGTSIDMISKGGYDQGGGTGLKLQIGDTAQGFNQLTVSVGDMSSSALGIGGIDISTREGAEAAISKIKDAINKVSSTRGDLGAVQNRLEHTINNLGVTTENLTAAESRIRDTDMASEMMQYTKNNILIQASQAMLAQANQVPQGVLQLLQ